MKKYKKNDLESYTLGTTLTLELLNKKLEYVKRVYIHSKQEENDAYNKIIKICNDNKIEVIYSDKIINTLSDKENCYIIGVFQKYEMNLSNSNHIVLVNPSNMGNLGTIIRSAVGFNIHDLVIIRPGVDSFDPKVIRSSMGAIFNINIKYFDSFDDYFKLFNDRNFYPFMLKAKDSLQEIKKEDKKYSLIFGNEGAGLPDEFLKVGTPVIIRHTKDIDSLNLDNAVAIALYEFSKK